MCWNCITDKNSINTLSTEQSGRKSANDEYLLFWSKFRWSLFLWVQLSINEISGGWGDVLVPNTPKAITWANDDLYSWRICVRYCASMIWTGAFHESIIREQGKSEGFESCDRPIVWKRPIWVKIGDVLYRVTLKFDGPWKTIGHLFFAVSSFVQHFIAIGEFKLELQSGNAQFGSNSTIFRAVWPWSLTYDLEKQ